MSGLKDYHSKVIDDWLNPYWLKQIPQQSKERGYY